MPGSTSIRWVEYLSGRYTLHYGCTLIEFKLYFICCQIIFWCCWYIKKVFFFAVSIEESREERNVLSLFLPV